MSENDACMCVFSLAEKIDALEHEEVAPPWKASLDGGGGGGECYHTSVPFLSCARCAFIRVVSNLLLYYT